MSPVKYIRSVLRMGGFGAILLGAALFLTQCTESLSDISSFESTSSENQEVSGLNNDSNTLPGGALYEISVPATGWKDLVIYAHGYVNPGDPLSIPDDSVEGVPISKIINNLGYAYATTSYRDNGLVIPDAVKDITFLLKRFKQEYRDPDLVYVVGPSEGGAVTTLAVEQHPNQFNAGFATCGPIGDFRKQLNYLGDFHVLFNYFFPGFEIGTPAGVPKDAIEDWNEGTLKDEVTQAIIANPGKTEDLLNVAKVPANRDNPEDVIEAVMDLLRYNILATNDAIDKLKGKPYSNIGQVYFGTGSLLEDEKLNQGVERYEADPQALHIIERHYQTSGDLDNPLVTMHTTFDHVIPYWHEPLYREKIFASQSYFSHVNIPILGRYGHCNFTVNEVLAGLSIMVYKTTLQNLEIPSSLVEESDRQQLLNLTKEHGVSPTIVPEREVIQ